MTHNRFAVLCAAVVLTVSAAPTLSHAQEDCKATLQSELRTTLEKDLVMSYVFKVDVTTSEACAEVDYKLSTTEKLPSGETKVIETPGRVRLRQGSTSQKLTYDMKKVNTMVEWKVEQVRCTRCEP